MSLSKEALERIRKNKEKIQSGSLRNSNNGGKEEEKTSTSSGSGVKLSDAALERIRKKKESIGSQRYSSQTVDDTYISLFLQDSQDFLNTAKSSYNKLDYNSAVAESSKSYFDDLAKRENDLRNRATTIRDYMNTNRSRFDDKSYKELASYLDIYSADSISKAFYDARDYYSQWETEDAYLDYDKKSKLDTAAAQKEIAQLDSDLREYRDLTRWETDERGKARAAEIRELYGVETERELEALLKEKKSFLGEAVQLQTSIKERQAFKEKYYSLMSEPDFDQYANAGAAIENPSVTDAESDGRFLWWSWDGDEVGNIVTYSRDNADVLAMAGGNTQGNYLYRNMNDDEVRIYNYLLAKYGKEKGDEFLSEIMGELSQREGGATSDRLQAIDIPVVEQLAIGGYGLMAGVDQWASGTRQYFTDEKLPTSAMQYANADLLNSMDGLGKYAYQATNVVGNMLPSIALSKGLGALGAGVKTAKVAGAATMSIGAAGNAYADGLDYGMEPWQARTYGTLVGAAEGALEYVMGGIPALRGAEDFVGAKINMIDNALLRVGAKVGWDVVQEIGEEELQNFLEPAFRALFTGEYDAPTFEELVETAIVTAISTPAMGGVGTVADDIRGSRAALKEYGGKTDALIQEGLESDVNTDSYKLAQKFQKQVQGTEGKAGKALTGNQIRNLLAANQEQITPKDMKLIQQAAEKRLTELGETGDVSKLASLATKYATGGKLSKEEKTFLTSSKYGSRVYNELLPKNIASGDYTTEWAEEIGTKQVNRAAYNKKAIVRDLVEAMTKGPNAYESLESRVKAEEPAKVSVTGKAAIRTTDEEIDLTTPTFKQISEDGVVLEVNGKPVNANDIDYDSEEQGLAISSIGKIEHITPAAASALYAKLDMTKPVMKQLNGMDEAFSYGFSHYSEADLDAGNFVGNLTQEQKMDAYNLGKYVAKQTSTDHTATMKKMRTAADAIAEKAAAEGKEAPKGKKLSITYNHGGGVIEDIATAGNKLRGLNKEQRGGIEAAKILHQMGIGTDFELFTSYYSKTLKDKDGNPLEVFLDDDGQEQAAYAGVYMAADGKIRINLNAYSGTKGLTLNALSHELTHFIKTWSLEKYEAMAEFLVKSYGEKGVSMNELVLKEQDRLKKIRGKEVSYSEAYDEVVANAFNRMLEDGKVMERIAEIRQVDNSLANKIIDGIKKFISRFFDVYRDNKSLFKETEALMEMKEVFEQLQNMFAEALVDASDNFQASLITKEAGLDIAPVEATTQYSYQSLAEAAGFAAVENENGTRSFVRDGQAVSEVTINDIENSPIGAFINFSLEMGDISDADAKKQKKMFADICTMACKTNDFAMTMQFVGSAVFTGMKANADKQYGTTYDFPSICTKTQAVIDAMSAKMVSLGRGLKTDEIVKLYDDVFASGNPVPCPECYVFSRWIGIGGLLDNIKKYQDYYGAMAVEDVAAEYRKMKAEVSKFAEEQGISFGKAKGALTSKLTKEFNKLTEKIEKAENQGEKVKPADLKRLEELEPMMNTVKGMTWLENVYFADSSLKKVNPKFRVPNEVLFDLNNGEAFASQYKDAWAFRTTQGAGYGKAITPYAEARLGEGILVTNNTTNAIKGKAQGSLNNYFLNQKGKLDKQSREALKRARMKQKIQAFIGGQRFQSTSDARYENASDYLLAALEMQAMGGMVQCYTKVDGAVPAFSAWGFSINQSLMPLNGGLDADGNVQDTAVGGMKPSVAFDNRDKHESAGTITIGVNDNHIRAMFKQWVRDFIIPYHASGGKADVVAEFRRIQEGKEAKGKAVRSTDYSRTQSDKILSDEVLRWQGKTDAQIQRIHEIRNARIAILTGGKVSMTVVRSNRFLSALYDKLNGGEWDGVKLAKSKVESQIFPNEFWDQTVSYEESAKITKDYLEYCDDLGFLHRFSGMVPSNGRLVPVNGYDQNGNRVQLTDLAYKYDESGNKTDEVEQFFWKVLTDRRMYDNSGSYLPQKVVTLNDTTTETVADFAKNNQGRQYDKAKAEALAKKIAGEQYSSQETDLDSDGNVLSKNQQQYFADSKVRDADGRLMVMYHGTANGGAFTVFDGDQLGNEARTSQVGQGFYFTNAKEEAESYTTNVDIYGRSSKGKNPYLHQVYLNITNPFNVVDDTLDLDDVKAVYGDGTYDYFFSDWIPFYLNRKSVNGEVLTKASVQAMSKEEKVSLYVDYLAQLGTKELLSNMVRAFPYGKQSELLAAMRNRLGYDGIVEEYAPGKYQYVAFSSEQIKFVDNKNPTTDKDLRYSSQETDLDKKRITIGMTDSERTKILQTKVITAEVYENQADKAVERERKNLESDQFGLVKAALTRIAEEFDVFTEYDIKDVQVKLEFSISNLHESVSKKITPEVVAKLMPVLKTAVENAVGIESHTNRYFYDTDIVRFDNLVGGYVDGEHLVPVRFGLKHRRNGEVILYVIVDQQKAPINKIKAEVVKIAGTHKVQPEVSRSAFKMSIPDIVPFVNSGDLLRYLPDDMLSENQKKVKWEAIADTIVRTNKKNDAKYAKYIREGKLRAAEQMVKAAANDAGYTTSGYHGSRTPGFTVVDKYLWLWLARDKAVASGYGTHNAVDSKGKPHDENGVYAMRYNLGNNLVVYADGASWGELPVTEDEYPGVYVDEENGFITTNAMAEWAERNGYDSITFVDVDDGGLTTVDVVFNPNRDVKSTDPITYDDDGNIIPISKRFNQANNDLRYSSQQTDLDIGYHAGDLGKSEGHHMQGGGRSTGHFGTGTYFVSNPKAIEGYNTRNGKPAPIEKVNLSDYNLYRIYSDEVGYKLHRNLQVLDGGVTQEFLDAAKRGDYRVSNLWSKANELADSYDNEVWNEDLGDFFSEDYFGSHIRAYTETLQENGVEFQTFEEWYHEYSGESPTAGVYEEYQIDYYDYLKDTLEKADEDRNAYYPGFRDAYTDLWLRFGKKQTDAALQNIVDHIKKLRPDGEYNYDLEYGQDSNATVFMKSLGYEGINVSGTGLDNTTYGSVIYDLKGKDLARKKEIGTARYSTQQTDNITDRDMLANAFETISRNSAEYEMVQDYKKAVNALNKMERELDEVNREIRDIRFSTGSRDNQRLELLESKAKRLAKDITRYDKRLLNMEASAPLRRVIQEERKKEAQRTKAHVQEIQQNKKLRAEQTEFRHKIRKTVRDLDKILNRGNKKQNVKEDMKGFVSKALDLADYIFTDHISNDELIRRGIDDDLIRGEREAWLVNETTEILSKLYDKADSLTDEEFTRLDAKRKANEDKLRDLLTAQRNRRLNTPVYNLFSDLVTEYASFKNSKQEAVKGAYDPKVEEFLRTYVGDADSDRAKALKNMRVADMTTDELWKLLNAYQMVLHSVRTANKLFASGSTESIEQMVTQIVLDFGSRKIPEKKLAIAAQKLSNMIGWDYEKLYYALDRIGSNAFSKLIMNLANSENTVMQDVREAEAFRDEIVAKYGFNNWDINKKIDREFLDNTGKKFDMTLGQLMSLYAYSRREGAWDHIEYGGFVFGEAALTNPKPADSYKLSKEQCEAITNTLTKEQKNYVEDMQKFLSETMGEKGNEVSMLLYGIKMFNEKNYFPIHIAGQFKAQANESQAKAAEGFQSMSNAGFTHAQNPNAKAPFVLEGFNEVWSDHVNEMSRYHGTVPALEDIRRVMNRSSYSESTAESTAVKVVMENHFGKEAVKYFDNLYREANSGAINDRLQKTSKKMLSLFRKNSVAYSLSVLVQQPASIVRAYALIDRKYFGFKGIGAITSGVTKAVFSKNKAYANAYNEMLKYAPGVTMTKEIGGFDTATGGSIRTHLLDTKKSFKQKMKTENALGKGKAVLDLVDDNAIANLPNVADKIAWIEIWNACKRETVAKHKDLTPGSDEFMKAVGERFTEVIRATQVYDSIFAKSPMLKSKNLAVQYLVSFMNEPNTVANMAESAVRNAMRGDWKQGARTAHVLIHSIIFTGVMKSLIYAMRDDDEDETYIEKYIESLAGSLLDDFNPLNYIPIARDVWSVAQGYDVERADMAIVSDAIGALNKVIKSASTDRDDLTEDELIELDKKVTKASWDLVDALAACVGIPMKNVRREVMGILNTVTADPKKSTKLSIKDTIVEAVIDSIPFMGGGKSKKDKLYAAIMEGDQTYLNRIKATYKTEDAYHSAVRTALRENDSRIREAALAHINGNPSERVRIAKQIIADMGNEYFNDVITAINSEINAMTPGDDTSAKKEKGYYTVEDFVRESANGDHAVLGDIRDDIILTAVKNGKTQGEAEKDFVSDVVSETKNAFNDGSLNEAGAKKLLMEYGDKNDEEAAGKVSYWAFCKAHPQYDLSEANVKDYHEFAEPSKIPLDVFVQYINGTKGLETIRDKWGDEVKTKREQVLEVIDSLPLTWQQKDALYLAAGYAESKIWDVPW